MDSPLSASQPLESEQHLPTLLPSAASIAGRQDQTRGCVQIGIPHLPDSARRQRKPGQAVNRLQSLEGLLIGHDEFGFDFHRLSLAVGARQYYSVLLIFMPIAPCFFAQFTCEP